MTSDATSHLVLIAAVARDGAIGRGNELLVRIPEDMARFKALTMGHTVLMGRKTWDSIPLKFRPLPGRRNLVLSRQSGLVLDGAEVFADIDSALAACHGEPQVFVMGGAQIYAATLPRADRLELTEIDAEFDADAFFPAWPREQFQQTARRTATSEHGWTYHFTTYERIGRL
ncbi:MAG: dihydrofolate reductase [Pelomonas sp.]|nr:dihydrofolate reductase [Roseateles sp.]